VSEHPPVIAQRALTVMAHLVIDELRWSSAAPARIELPTHARARVESAATWSDATLDGGDGLEDGFSFARDAKRARIDAGEIVRLVDTVSGATIAWITSSEPADWFTAVAPGAPGAGDQRFLLVRAHSAAGRIRSVWSPMSTVREVSSSDARLQITHADGTMSDYEWRDDGANVGTTRPGESREHVVLSGFRGAERSSAAALAAPLSTAQPSTPHSLPFVRELGEPDYRMSEHSWADAGSPRAHVVINADDTELEVRVAVRKSTLHFRAPDDADPELDNEHPDIHSDGVQLHLWSDGWREPAAWLAIPERGFSRTRLRQSAGASGAPAVAVDSREIIGGYEIRFTVPRASLSSLIALDVLVNDMSPDRQRRRGQLVLSGAHGDRVYLRGDRQPLEHFIRLRLPE
jgi:hypothetical protein